MCNLIHAHTHTHIIQPQDPKARTASGVSRRAMRTNEGDARPWLLISQTLHPPENVTHLDDHEAGAGHPGVLKAEVRHQPEDCVVVHVFVEDIRSSGAPEEGRARMHQPSMYTLARGWGGAVG